MVFTLCQYIGELSVQLRLKNISLPAKAAILCLLFFAPCLKLHAQDSTKDVQIIHADFLKYAEVGGKRYTRLIGDVQLLQGGAYLFCDSANMQRDSNTVDAFGHVRIEQDTIKATSDILYYNGNTKLARLVRNVTLTDTKMKLLTSELWYNMSDKTAYYLVGGKVLRTASTITSKKGYYFSNKDEVFFRDQVHIQDTNYTLDSDTLKYNISTDVSTFFGNTTIYNKESTIYCNNGWYDARRDVASFGKGTIINNPPQILRGDSIYYERFNGYGKVPANFHWYDSTMEVSMIANFAEFWEETKFLSATQHPVMIYKMEKDSLFITADTLQSRNKSVTDTTKLFFGFHHVRMFSRDMQGVCDSMFYSFADSTFRMFYKPILWSDNTQLSADTMYLTIKEKKADRLSMYNAGFIIAPNGDKFYDQIKGKNIFGYFLDNALDKVHVVSNAESLYFGKDEKEKYVGSNKVLSTTMWLRFAEKKLSKITFIQQPEAKFTPIKMLPKEDYTLKDFKWQIDKKPKSREEILQPQTVKTK